MKNKFVGVLAWVVFALTLIWLAQMILVNARLGEITQFEQALAYAQERHWFYYTAVYANVVLLTLANVLLYGGLYGLLKNMQPVLSAAGFAFIPMYGMLALVSYLSQLVVVPVLLSQLADPQSHDVVMSLLQHILQSWPNSTILWFDQCSYFLLGFPGLLFGLVMMKDANLRLPGILFSVAGGFCLLIGVGILLNIMPLVSIPSMLGGVLSIAATGLLAWRLCK